MAINYISQNISSGPNDGCALVLREAQDHFQGMHLSILGESIRDIVSDDSVWSDYKTQFMKGVDPAESDALSALMDNSRIGILRESMSGITPISSLSVPTIRRLWPKLALKNAMPTEVVKIPKFSVSYMMPYILRDGVKHMLPESILPGGSAESANMGIRLYTGWIELADFAQVLHDGSTENVSGAQNGFNMLDNLPDGTAATAVVGDSIDPDYSLTAVKMEVTDSKGIVTTEEITGLNIVCSLQGGFNYEVVAYGAADKEADGTPKPGAKKNVDRLFGAVNYEQGVLHLASSHGKIKAVKQRGRLSQEFNNHSESVSFDITTREITVGSGQHINAPLPAEFLQDAMAMYNIDGASKIVDIMTTVFAQRLDSEIRDFLISAYSRTNQRYGRVFDCKPPANFYGTPKSWREMIKDVVEYLSQKMRQDHYYQGGEFVIVGNPLDINLFPNVTWIFQGGASNADAGGRSGVEVDYTISTWSGVNRYTLVASQNIPQGEIYMFFVSSLDEQMTFKYFPYSFNVEKGYLDPNFQNVPSLMMAKRHKLETFKDCIAKIRVLNNKGDMNFVHNVDTNTP